MGGGYLEVEPAATIRTPPTVYATNTKADKRKEWLKMPTEQL